MWVNIALRRFLHIEAISQHKEARLQGFFLVHSTIGSTVHLSISNGRRFMT